MTKEMNVEIGVVTAHPITQMWYHIKRIFRTWMFCRKHGYPCNKWYGVYPVGSDNVLADCGPLPGAEERCDKIAKAIDGDSFN